MRFSGRVLLCLVVLMGTTGAFFTSCSSNRDSGGEDPPRTADDVVEVSASGAASVAVLGNDQNLTNEPLQLTIEDSPFVGRASVNSDNTVRLDLPSGFRGVTRFRYRVTNALGGFSTSTAVVFVDVPAYRVLFAAQTSTRPLELFVTDLTSPVQLSQATSGNLRLQNAWRSSTGGLVVYERADPSQTDATREMFYVRTRPVASPVRIQQPLGRAFVSSEPVVISDDDRWIAFVTAPASGSGQATNLYVLDTSSSASATLVGLSSNLQSGSVQWIGDRLYFMSALGGTLGTAVHRASPGNFDSPQRVSPVYSTADTIDQVVVSPDQTQLVLLGTHAGQNGAFLVDPADPDTQRRLTLDMPAGALIESFRIDDDFGQLTYLWRLNNATTARLSVVPLATTGLPRTVLDADITSFTELRPDGATALITRGPGGSGSDGVLYEVSLDRSVLDQRITSDVTGGVYDDTGDRVYLFSRTLAPAVLERADFNRSVSPLVRNTTPALALFVAPVLAPTAAILEDPAAGLVLVNAYAAGKTLSLTDRDVGSVPSTLLPDAIEP